MVVTGSRLLADVAEVTGLTRQFGQTLAGLRQRDGGHDPGRIAVDVAGMIADGGEAIADLAVLGGQLLGQLRAARAQAREVAWAPRYETRGGFPEATAAGWPVAGLVFGIDATIVVCIRRSSTPSRPVEVLAANL